MRKGNGMKRACWTTLAVIAMAAEAGRLDRDDARYFHDGRLLKDVPTEELEAVLRKAGRTPQRAATYYTAPDTERPADYSEAATGRAPAEREPEYPRKSDPAVTIVASLALGFGMAILVLILRGVQRLFRGKG